MCIRDRGYDDKVLGRIECSYREVDDFVIVRSNGKPLYLLCNVVDDIRDRITHIIRGQDHMTNTTRQVLLYEALGAPVPVFAHIPLTLDTKKAKISKRSHGEIVAVHFYREHGFIPWAFNNFLVLLGWSPGDDREFFSKGELIEAFTLERINKSSSIFNFRKDDPKFFTDPKAIAINAHYLRTLPIDEIGEMVREELTAEGLWEEAYAGDKKQWYLQTLDLIRDRFHTLKDFATLGRAYFAEDYQIDEKPLQKNVLKFPELQEWLPILADRYEQLAEFTADEAEKLAREMAGEKAVKPGVIINAMRTVITGQLAGPSMFDVLMTIGRERIVQRMRKIGRLF
jgi:glutamyl-tRNA synthetase